MKSGSRPERAELFDRPAVERGNIIHVMRPLGFGLALSFVAVLRRGCLTRADAARTWGDAGQAGPQGPLDASAWKDHGLPSVDLHSHELEPASTPGG